MKKILALILCLLLAAALAACNSEEQVAEGPFKVGFSRAVITPDTTVPIHMSGTFGNNKISEGKLDDLYATCVAFTDATGETVLLFHLDLQHVNLYASVARDRLSKTLELPPDNIIIATTHTHSAPAVKHYLNESYPRVTEYVDTILLPGIMDAAKQAMEDRKPAQMYGASIKLDNLNFVRHYNLSDGTVAGDNFGSFDGKTILGHVSDADNQMQLLCFRREGGKDVVMMNWQAHPHRTGVNHPNFTSDVVGAARDYMEAELDCNFAYFTGASGNVNCFSRITAENITKDYIEQGQELAKHGIMALEGMKQLKLGRVQMLKEVGNANGADMDVYAFSIGDAGFAVAPYEMFSENGEKIKQKSPFDITFVVTCATGKFGYFPSQLTYAYNSYEYQSDKIQQGNAEEMEDLYVQMLEQLHPTRELAGQTDPVLAAQPQSKLYWNLDRAIGRTADADGSYAVRLLCDGRVVTVKADEEMLSKIDATDVMGLALDGDKVTAVHRLIDMSYKRMASSYSVQSLEGGKVQLNASSTMRGTDVSLPLSDDVKMWSVNNERPLAGELKLGDIVTAVCDAEGNPVELFVTEMSVDLTELETTNLNCAHCSREVPYYLWTFSDSVPNTAGHFILQQDVELTKPVKVLGGDICMDLNGKIVTQTTFGERMYEVNGPATLSIIDSVGSGAIISAETDSSGASSGMIIHCDSVMATIKLYSGTLDATKAVCELACGIYMKSGTMEMHGGTLKGGKTYGSGSGCICVGEASSFVMYGGTMIGGHVQDSGYNTGTLIKGGGIMRVVGEATIYDGEFIGGYSDLNGGALYVKAGGTLNLLGGTISGGESVGIGAGLCVEPNGILVLGGDVKITDNVGTNFFADPRAMVSIHPDGLSGAKIGVSCTEPGLFLWGTFTTRDAACFYSDDPNMKVVLTESGLALEEK